MSLQNLNKVSMYNLIMKCKHKCLGVAIRMRTTFFVTLKRQRLVGAQISESKEFSNKQ